MVAMPRPSASVAVFVVLCHLIPLTSAQCTDQSALRCAGYGDTCNDPPNQDVLSVLNPGSSSEALVCENGLACSGQQCDFSFLSVLGGNAAVLKAGKHGSMCDTDDDCGCPIEAGQSCLIRCRSVMVPSTANPNVKVSEKRCAFSQSSLVPGDPCSYDEECASGSCLGHRCAAGTRQWGALCDNSDQCAGDGQCSGNGTANVCQSYLRAQGQRCFPTLDTCSPEASLTCRPDTTNTNIGTCVVRGALNQPCVRLNGAGFEYLPCQDNLQCRAPNPQFGSTSTGTCVPYAQNGAACTLPASQMGGDHTTPVVQCANRNQAHGLQCVVTQVGNVTGVCHPYLENGDVCQSNAPGPSPATCDPNATPTLSCLDGVCSPPTGPGLGEACDFTEATPCASPSSESDPWLKCVMYQAPNEQTFTARCTANGKLPDGTLVSCPPSGTQSGRSCTDSHDPQNPNAALLCTSGVAVDSTGGSSGGGGGTSDTVYKCLSDNGAFGSTGASCPAFSDTGSYTSPLGYECVCTLHSVSAGMLLPLHLLKAPTASVTTTVAPSACYTKSNPLQNPSIMCLARVSGIDGACGFLVSNDDSQLMTSQPVRMTPQAVAAINAPACMTYALQKAVFVTGGTGGAVSQCKASLNSACGAKHDFGSIDCGDSGGGGFPTWAIVVIVIVVLLVLVLVIGMYGRNKFGWCRSEPGYSEFAPSGIGATEEDARPRRGGRGGRGRGRGGRGKGRGGGRGGHVGHLVHTDDPDHEGAGTYVPPDPQPAHTQELPPSMSEGGAAVPREPQTSFSSLAEDDADVEDLGEP